MSAKRILYAHNSADLYGASRSLSRLLRTIDRQRFEPLALLPAEGELAEKLRAMQVRVIVFPMLSIIDRAVFHSWRLPLFLLTLPIAILRLALLIRREKVALVHSNVSVLVSTAPAAWLAGVPHVYHIREAMQEFRTLWRFYERWMTAFSVRILAVSEAMAAQFSDRTKVRVLHNGFDLAEFPLPEPAMRQSFREKHGLGDRPVVGCVGRIKLQRKGQEVLLEAASLLKQRGVRARYLVVGAPYQGNESHLARLREIVRQTGLDGDVVFTGELSDPRPAYAAMDISVLPSAQPEPFGGVVMEAMCMGLPVIATAIGGSVEQVADGETGFLVAPADPAALAEKLEILLRDAALRERFGRAGLQRIVERFTLEGMIKKLEGIYGECLGRD
jgi:glycosyltransferase involved in cell wall biosynthesis